MRMPLKSIDAGVLNIAYAEFGPASGWPVILLHGFPYDIHAYVDVAPKLASEGARVIVPFLRGYGATRFRDSTTLRSGQQAALGADLLALMDALQIDRAVLGGYDWGGRAACIVAALWPERVVGLVSATGYNIQDIARSGEPASPDEERAYWYQYYFHGERGRAGLTKNRAELCGLLWRLWSPTWAYTDTTYANTAASFDNPDFVDVVIHSYRHRYNLAAGDPAYDAIEGHLAKQPRITVPTIAIDGDADGVVSREFTSADDAPFFTGGFEHRVLSSVGHNVPQEAPTAFALAILALRR